MEKEFIIDQEDVQVIPVDDIEEVEDLEENEYPDIPNEDFTVKDESQIDWSDL